MYPDPWLTRWLPLVIERAGRVPILEIGCGFGDDTIVLTEAGLEVTAFDLSPGVVARARQRVPGARIEQRDVRAPLPVGVASTGVVIASLSLHYFPWADTVSIVGRIRDVLCAGGVLLCRLNSSGDHNYGASGHEPIEPDYYLVDGEPKRFFDRAAVESLFIDDWRCLSLQEYTTHKYPLPKVVWEVVLERAGCA